MKHLILFISLLISFTVFSQVDVEKSFLSATTSLDQILKFNKDGAACSILKMDRSLGTFILKSKGGEKFEVSVISEEYLQELFRYLASQKHIPFRYPEDGCYARAHEMARLMDEKGVVAGKAFIEGSLRVETKNSPKGYVNWRYHVAPFVVVRKDHQNKVYVIDPSLFDHPVSVADWYNIQTKDKRSNYYTPRFVFSPASPFSLSYKPLDAFKTKITMEDNLKIQNLREKEDK